MENTFFTLQEFMAYTKSVVYILMLVILVGVVGFWRFLSSGAQVEQESDHKTGHH